MPGENEEGLTSLLSGDEAREDEGAPPPSVGDNPSRGNETHERSDRYAKVEILKKYIPELDPKPERSAKRSTMLTIHMMVALLVVLVNCTILFVVLKFYPPNTRFVGTFMFDNCKLISAINSALHMGLNMISTFFLGAGNFCMQILVAPSRKEIDKAHSKGISLEIGVPSIKNLPHIRRRRRVLWGLLGLMSSLLHLFWNSVIFTSIPITAIPRAIATNDFLVVRDNWTTSDPLGHFSWWKAAPGYGDAALNKSLIYSLETSAPTFTRLNTKDCIARSIDPLNATSSLIVVARNISSQMNNGSSLIDGWVSTWQPWTWSTSWICSAVSSSKYCNAEFASTFADHWEITSPGVHIVEVDYCLASDEADNEQRCGLHYSALILAFVCFFTFLSSLFIAFTWLQYRREVKSPENKEHAKTMVTMGDLVHSFLSEPSNLTRDESNRVTPKSSFVEMKLGKWQPRKSVAWYKAINRWVLALSGLSFFVGLLVPAIPLAFSFEHLRSVGLDMSFTGVWKQGFKVQGAATTTQLGHSDSVGTSWSNILANISIANSPQLMISVLYLFYNNILTRQLIADEWIRFLRKDGKKPLRVSSPIGMQRSSYFLSLPWKYSGPLMVSTILLHWLISQSIFLVQSSAFGPGAKGVRLPEYDISARGYSPFGAILAIAFGGLLVLAIMVNSIWRRYRNIPLGFQLMGFNSSAIRAMCERPENDSDAHLFPISIGIMCDKRDGTPGSANRLGFSTDIDLIQPPESDTEYLIPVFAGSKDKRLFFY